MALNESLADLYLANLRRELEQPGLSLEEATRIPLVKAVFEALSNVAPAAEADTSSGPLPLLLESSIGIRAAIEHSFELSALQPTDAERNALIAASDIVMIDGRRRLTLNDSVRASVLDKAIGNELYESTLRQAVEVDNDTPAALAKDPVRLPSIWLRRFLSNKLDQLEKASPDELKAALSAREQLRYVKQFPTEIPSLDDLNRRVGLAELLEPLRLLIGAHGTEDRFKGRKDEMTRLRGFVAELSAQSTREFFGRAAAQTKLFITRGNPPDLMVVEGQGGLGKSTLLAKFVLDHALEQSRPFPFAYLDFDRAALDPARPLDLLVEIAGQVALQYPNAQEKIQHLRDDIRADRIKSPGIPTLASTTANIRDPYSRFVEILRDHATFGTRAFLLVLDTIEVVQWDASSMVKLGELVDELRSKGLRELRVVASGRADVPELRKTNEPPDPKLHITLQPLSIGEARELADSLGRAAIGDEWGSTWSAAIAGNDEQADNRREPLAVRVAVDLIARSEPEQRQPWATEIAKAGFDASDDFVARLYEARILKHVRDPVAAKLAWPGLVIRRITPEIARELLADYCDIPPEDAAEACAALGREVWMVTSDGDTIRHRQELRARTLPLMRGKEHSERREKFNAVAGAAVDYFGRNRSRSEEDYQEWIYHRFLLGEETPEEIEPDIRELLTPLAQARADFSAGSAAASYLTARAESNRLSPSRILQLRTNDALRHLSITSTGVFGLDDVSVDDIAWKIADSLSKSPSLAPELIPWSWALWIKTGAWTKLPRTSVVNQSTAALLRPLHLYWAARVALILDQRDRARLVEQCLRAVDSPGFVKENLDMRTAIHAMALARMADSDAFARFDSLAAGFITETPRTSEPSAQAALRTAIVLGERCRAPALKRWLGARRRGSSDRVRSSTVSLTELRMLSRIRPALSESLLRVTEGGKSNAPLRILDEQTVSVVIRELEELLGQLEDGATGEQGWRALARVFAARDEDWIVPMSYAAARAPNIDRLLSSLASLLADYSRPFKGSQPMASESFTDMLGAMCAADESADLVGFSRHVLAECDPSTAAATHLKFLLDCRNAWSKRIASIVGSEVLSGLDQAPEAVSERPPKPRPVVHRDDPQKDRWGGLDTRNGRAVRVVIESVERTLFYFSVIVESIDGSVLAAPVIFHLHDSYPRSIVTIQRIVNQRTATLSDWNATGVFAIGVQVKDATGQWISLETDLAKAPDLPNRFLER